MLDDVYNARILALAADIPRLGRLAAPGGTATAPSRLCGSTVTADVALGADGRVAAYAQDVKACALGQASAAIVGRGVLGSAPEELRAVAETVRAMLKAGGPPPGGRWADCAVLEPVRQVKARHASTLLAFEAAAEAAERAAGPAAGARRAAAG